MVKQQEKQEQIVELAVKRLAHFGIHKTTFAEIAADAGLSKQALLYYFPDKQALIMAVIHRLFQSYLASLKRKVALASNIEAVMMDLVEARYQYFSQYHRVFNELIGLEVNKLQELESLRLFIRQQEEAILAPHFTYGMELHEIAKADPHDTIQLLQETLDAFFINKIHEKHSMPEMADFKNVVQKQKQLVRLMYRGLRA